MSSEKENNCRLFQAVPCADDACIGHLGVRAKGCTVVGHQTLLYAPAGSLLLLDVVSGDIGVQGGAYGVGLAGSRPQDGCQLLTGGGDKAARQRIVQIQGRTVGIGKVTQTRSAQHDAKCGCTGGETRVKLAGVARCGRRGLLGHQYDLPIAPHRDLVSVAAVADYGAHNGYIGIGCTAVDQCGIGLYGNGVGLLRRSAGDIKTGVAFRKAIIYRHMEGPATLIAHSGKGNVAAFRQSGLVYKIAAGDGKLGRVGVAYIHGVGKQAAADGKRGGTSSGDNLVVKQAVFDGDGSVIILKLHTLFKGSALDRGLIAGRGVYLNSFLKGAAGDGFVVDHHPLEGTVGDGAVVVHILLEGTAGDGAGVAHHPLEGAAGDGLVVVPPPQEDAAGYGAPVVHIPQEAAAGDGVVVEHHPLEGTAGDGAVVIHIRLEGAAGDGSVVVHLPLEGTVGDGSEVSHLPLEDAVEDGAVIVGFTADGAAD